ncbi:MAG: subtilisin family serine protease, partial [Myxococcota bacterium]
MIWLVTALLAVASPPDTADLAGDERRVVEVEPGTAEDVAKLLRLIPGVEVLLAADPLIEVRAADDILPWLRSAPAVRTVRPAMALEYSLDSQGPAQMGADAWLDLGVTGQGVTVAIVDVGFQNWDAMAAAGEVPDNAVVMRGNDACLSSSRHGTAVAEIVYEMAPDVTFLLYCAQTDPQFLAAIQQIRQDGVDVVNASVGLPNAWADDGSSPWTSAIEASMSEGTVWSVAVGNSLNKWWSGVATDADADGLLEMDGLEALPMNSNVGRTILRVRWDEPFEGASENVDATVMVDGQPCATGARVQDGTISPWEQVVCTGMTGDATLSLSSVSPDAGVGR